MSFISGIIPMDKRRVKVYLDGEFAFVLYKSECVRFGLKENDELTPEIYDTISGVLCKRAINRAVYLLKDRDYTEGMLVKKLKEAGYPEDAVSKVIDKMKSYGYVDDYNYAESFVRGKACMMSRRELEYKLHEKQVSRDVITQVMDAYEENCEGDIQKQAFYNIYRKKHINYQQLDAKGKQKLISYFLRKGFLYEDIVSFLYEIDNFN